MTTRSGAQVALILLMSLATAVSLPIGAFMLTLSTASRVPGPHPPELYGFGGSVLVACGLATATVAILLMIFEVTGRGIARIRRGRAR